MTGIKYVLSKSELSLLGMVILVQAVSLSRPQFQCSHKVDLPPRSSVSPTLEIQGVGGFPHPGFPQGKKRTVGLGPQMWHHQKQAREKSARCNDVHTVRVQTHSVVRLGYCFFLLKLLGHLKSTADGRGENTEWKHFNGLFLAGGLSIETWNE